LEKARIYRRFEIWYDIYVGRLLRRPPQRVRAFRNAGVRKMTACFSGGKDRAGVSWEGQIEQRNLVE